MVGSFSRLLSDGDTPDRTLAVLDDGQPEPVWDLFVNAFGDLGIDLVDTDLDGIRFHTGHTEPYRKSWFVVFSPPDERIDPAALLAYQTDSNVWRSTWTYEPKRVVDIRDRIERTF